MTKILIIRLSSIGDIIQCMGIIGGLRHRFADAQIHWVARSDMAETLSIDSRIDKVWSLDKSEGSDALVRLSKELKAQNFDYVYDAHNNLRSIVIKHYLRRRLCNRPRIVVRSKSRFKRILLFKFGINLFDWPFVGVDSFRSPLRKWGVTEFDPAPFEYKFSEQISSKFSDLIAPNSVTLVPSATWQMKRWPVGHWQRLIELLPACHFVVLGGPSDSFCADICSVAPERTVNLAGKSSIMESSYIVSASRVVVSGDTGFLHSADLFGVPAIALMGPSAFGYPSRPTSEIVTRNLKCQPCSKDGHGTCKRAIYQQCMVEITPEEVAQKVLNKLSAIR